MTTMDIDFENDKGINLLMRIMTARKSKELNDDDFSEADFQELEVRIENLLEIILGDGAEKMQYFTDDESENPEADLKRQEVIYETTTKVESTIIGLMKDYFATGDLKPLQDYLDQLLEDGREN